MAQQKPDEIEVFCSYAHADEKLRDKLAKHLAPLQREGVISMWHDRRIAAGKEWKGAIDAYLQSAGIILLLVSSDFIASDYCWSVEVTRAMERHEAGEARVIPVILRPCDWQSAPFGKLQGLPKNAKPITTWPNQDGAFLDVARGIRLVTNELASLKFDSLSEESGKADAVRPGAGKAPFPQDRSVKPFVKPFVFVLMPLREDFRDIYEFGIRPACEEAGAYCERVDEKIFQGRILERVDNQIAKADLIVADMTGRNANVFQEIGYARALKKPIILLTQKVEDIPFDLKGFSRLVYEGRITKVKAELRHCVRMWIDDTNENGDK